MNNTLEQEATDSRCREMLSRNIFFEEQLYKRVCKDINIHPAGIPQFLANHPCPSMFDILEAMEVEYRIAFLEHYIAQFDKMLPV